MQDEEDDNYCDELKRLREECDITGVTEHLSHYCKKCSDLKLGHFSGKEKLFTNIKQPSWIQEKNEEKKVFSEKSAEATSSETKKLRVAPRKVTSKSSKEEIEETINKLNMQPGITDGKLSWEIQRLKSLSEIDARKEVIELRKRKREALTKDSSEPGSKKVKQETKLSRDQKKTLIMERKGSIPWTPAIKNHFPQDEYSVLFQDEHKRLVSIYQSYISHGKYRFTGNKEDVKQSDNKLAEERSRLNQLIVEQCHPFVEQRFPTVEYIETYCKIRQAKRFEAVYGMKFYKEPIEVIPWDTPSSNPEDAKTAECYEITVQGQTERLRIPSLEDRLTLQTKSLTNAEVSHYQAKCANRFPIEEDFMALDICLEKGVSIAMDASTACYLMTDSFLTRPELSRFSITVKNKIHNGVLNKIAFISKPKHGGKQYSFVSLKMFSKYAFKNQYIEKRKKDVPSSACKLNELDNLVQIAHKEDNEEQISSNSSALDPLESIMSAITSTSGNSTKSSNKTGKRYSLFKIGGHKVLIRSSAPYFCHADKIEQLNCKQVALETAIEWLPNIGATRLEQEELLYHYCKQIFKQAEALALVRIGIENKSPQYSKPKVDVNVLQIHPMVFFTDSVSADIEKNMKTMFANRSERLERLLTTISTLEEGIFILHQRTKASSAILTISKEHNVSEIVDNDNIINFLVHTPVMKSGKYLPNQKDFGELFEGIDHRFMLQWQIYLNRVPGAFIARDSNLANEINRRKNPHIKTTGAAHKRRVRKRNAENMKKQEASVARIAAGKEQQKSTVDFVEDGEILSPMKFVPRTELSSSGKDDADLEGSSLLEIAEEEY